MALDPHVSEAVGRAAWLEHVAGPPGRHDVVDLAGGERLGQEREVDAQMIGRDVTVADPATRRGSG